MSLWLYIIEKMAREIVSDEPEPKLPDLLLGVISVLFGSFLCLVALLLLVLVAPYLVFVRTAEEIGCVLAVLVGVLVTLLVGSVLIFQSKTPVVFKWMTYSIMGWLTVAAAIAWAIIMLLDQELATKFKLLLPTFVFGCGAHWLGLAKKKRKQTETDPLMSAHKSNLVSDE